jgi:hypothetical protein
MANHHNKKRNTALLYEVLVKNLSKAILDKDQTKKKKTLSLLREFFNKKTILNAELKLYQSVILSKELDKELAERMLEEALKQHSMINQKMIFSEQSRLISQINRALTKQAYSVFVPNYKSIATVYQMFHTRDPKEKILLENKVIEEMTMLEKKEKELKPLDQLTMKTFINNFNKTYGKELLDEQKKLLNKFVFSDTDGGVDFKIYINEEITRLKAHLEKSDEPKSKQVIELLESHRKGKVDIELIRKVMQVQELVLEMLKDK